MRSYSELHRRGLAHSVEVWEEDELVGGLYGVTLGGFFGGESMFHRRTDASKAAVGHLVERLRAGGFSLLDAQVPTPHLARLGAVCDPARRLPRPACAARSTRSAGFAADVRRRRGRCGATRDAVAAGALGGVHAPRRRARRSPPRVAMPGAGAWATPMLMVTGMRVVLEDERVRLDGGAQPLGQRRRLRQRPSRATTIANSSPP